MSEQITVVPFDEALKRRMVIIPFTSKWADTALKRRMVIIPFTSVHSD